LLGRSAELGAPLEDDEVAKVAALRELEPLRLSTVARASTPEPPRQTKKNVRATKKAQGILYGKKHRDKVLDRLGVGTIGVAHVCGTDEDWLRRRCGAQEVPGHTEGLPHAR
jgi:hypothetical protein